MITGVSMCISDGHAETTTAHDATFMSQMNHPSMWMSPQPSTVPKSQQRSTGRTVNDTVNTAAIVAAWLTGIGLVVWWVSRR